MKIIEILDDFWFRLKWFFKDDIIKFLSWVGIYILGGTIIAYFSLKEFYERRMQKWKTRKKKKG